MSGGVPSVEIVLPFPMRPEEPGGGVVTGFCFGVWPSPHRIPREQHSIPVKAQGFPEGWSDVQEDVNLGGWASARDPPSLSALILLFGDERVASG